MWTELEPLTLERARGGDPRARELFLRLYVNLVASLVRASGVPEPKDVTQDVCVELLESLDSYQARPSIPVHSWVAAATHHHLVDVKRRRQLKLLPLEAASDVAAASPAPDAALDEEAEREELAHALSSLPRIHRRAILLASLEGRPLAQVAQAEGVPVGTIKSRLTNARRQLRRLIRAGEQEGTKARA